MSMGSTIAAAQRMGLSQPAVSRLLSQLETDFGLPLFQRRKGRLHPSDDAQALLHDVQGMILAAESLQRHVKQRRLDGMRRTRLRVPLPVPVVQAVMPAVSRAFLKAYPQVALELLAGRYEANEAAVLGREADVVMVRVPTLKAGLQLRLRPDTDASCIMPAGHLPQACECVQPADLIGLDLVLLGRHRSLRQQVDHAFRQGRLTPLIRAEVHSVEMACRMVAQGMRLSVVNGLFARLCLEAGVMCRPFAPRIAFQLGLATLAGQPPHALAPELARRIVCAMAERAGPQAFGLLAD